MYNEIRDINRDTRSTWAELGSVDIAAKRNWIELGISMGWISLGDARRLFNLDDRPELDDCVIKGGSNE